MIGLAGKSLLGLWALFLALAQPVETGEPSAALARLQRLADQGEAGAQYSLGLRYHDGVGVAQDYRATATWWRRAAEHDEVAREYMWDGK